MPNELLPTNIGFGTVVGRFGSAPLIAGDADGLPDFSPATGLTVTFTPSTAAVIDATASPAPVTIEMVPIVCGLDTQGYLVGGDGQRGVKLIATNDTDINPSGWTYNVTFLRGGAKVAAFRDFSMSLPAGVTKDIALTIPVPSSEGVSLSQAQAAEAAAVAAASQASAAAAAAAASAATFVPATVDTLGQATTFSKALVKTADATAARNALSAVGKGELVLNVKDFGAVGNGVADDTAAIQAALDAAVVTGAGWTAGAALPSVTVHAKGIYKITDTITIKSAVDFSQAAFRCYITNTVAIQVNDPAAAAMYNTDIKLPELLNMNKTFAGWAQVAGSTGVRVTNLYACRVYLNKVSRFETGFWGHANGVNGSSYNTFFLAALFDNKVNLKLAPNTTGSTATSSWFNTNVFIGGSFNHSSFNGTQVAGTRHFLIAPSTWPVDDNKFVGASLESNDVIDYFIECYGLYNIWDRCRFENTGGAARYRVLWRASSNNNLITRTLGTDDIVFTAESGSYNHGNAIPLTPYTTASRPPSLGIGGLAMDTTLGRPIFSSDGILTKVVALQEDIASTMSGIGTPEGVVTAPSGTLYSRLDAGSRINYCKYPISDTVAATTGWAAVGGTLTVGSGYLRNTLTSSPGNTSRYVCSPNSSTMPVPFGAAQYTFQGQARASIALPVQLRVQFYTSGFAATGSLQVGTSTALTANVFTDVTPLTCTAPADAAFVFIYVAILSGTANAAGDTLDLRHVIFEASSGAQTYFDGSFASGSGAIYTWTGTPQASTSTASYTARPISYVKTGGTNSTGWKAMAPAGGISVTPPASDAATTQALVNDLRAALVATGIVI